MNILITGTSSGIGEALAIHFSNQKDTPVTWIERVTRKSDWNIIPFDLSHTHDLEMIFPLSVPYDVIILNAWVGYFNAFEEIKSENNTETIHTNLLSNIELLRLLKKHNNIADEATIITLWSQASKHFYVWWAAYQASKWWLRGFIGSLRKEWKQYRFYLIHPQIVATRFFRNTKDGVIPSHLPRTKKEDITEIIDNILHWVKKYDWEIDC